MSDAGCGAGRRGAWRASLAAVVLAVAAAGADAKLCGDEVDGQDVPCACGDIVASSVALAADPVLEGPPCPADGLIVRAPNSNRAVVLDLRGATLRGAGGGIGIRIVDGGPGGARVISSGGVATISGFIDGIVARGPDTVALIEDVAVAGSGRDGLRVTASDFEIRRVEVRAARRDGFALGGRGFLITDTRAAECGRFGYSVMGQGGRIGRAGGGNVAEGSGDAGFNILGSGHGVTDCIARLGRKTGVHLQASDLDVRGCRASDNGGDGIDGMGNSWRLADNEALRNAGDGITLRGAALQDQGGNRGADNRGSSEAREVVQCSIGGVPCVL